MKPIAKQSDKKAAFTIVELLTVMSIIILLIGLLVPGLNLIRQFAKRVKQKAQFHSIGIAIDLFNAEWDGYVQKMKQVKIDRYVELHQAAHGRFLKAIGDFR